MTHPRDAAAAPLGEAARAPGTAPTQPGAPAPARRGAWRTLARGAAGFAAAVVANAGVQAVLVAFTPDIALSPLGVLLASVSAAAMLAASVLLWRTAFRASTVRGATGRGERTPDDAVATALPNRVGTGRLVVRCAIVGLITALAAVALPVLVPVVIALGCISLATGGLRASGALIKRHPFRVTGLVLVTAIVVVLLEAVALLFGLFVAGWLAATFTWLASGAAAAVLVAHWQSLAARATSAPPPGRAREQH